MDKQPEKQQEVVNLPPIEANLTRSQSAKQSPGKVFGQDAQGQSTKAKPALKMDFTVSHPLLIGVEVEDLYPVHSELVDSIYKRPLVVSLLIPKKKPLKKSGTISAKDQSISGFASSAGEDNGEKAGESDAPSSRPSSVKDMRRMNTSSKTKKGKSLRVLILKVYDLVVSKEAMYSIVVRDFEKQLDELIADHESEVVREYFDPQSITWWKTRIKDIVVTYGKPSGDLSVIVDKKLIAKYVSTSMENHNWMQESMTQEQIDAQRKADKRIISHSSKLSPSKKEKDKKNRGLSESQSTRKRAMQSAKRPLSKFLSEFTNPVPWNDNVNTDRFHSTTSFVGDNGGEPDFGTASQNQTEFSLTNTKFPDPGVRPPVLHEVGDWVRGNHKRMGQWLPGIVKRVHKNNEYYDIEYDNGKLETKVEARLVRKAKRSSYSQRSSNKSNSNSASVRLEDSKNATTQSGVIGEDGFDDTLEANESQYIDQSFNSTNDESYIQEQESELEQRAGNPGRESSVTVNDAAVGDAAIGAEDNLDAYLFDEPVEAAGVGKEVSFYDENGNGVGFESINDVGSDGLVDGMFSLGASMKAVSSPEEILAYSEGSAAEVPAAADEAAIGEGGAVTMAMEGVEEAADGGLALEESYYQAGSPPAPSGYYDDTGGNTKEDSVAKKNDAIVDPVDPVDSVVLNPAVAAEAAGGDGGDSAGAGAGASEGENVVGSHSQSHYEDNAYDYVNQAIIEDRSANIDAAVVPASTTGTATVDAAEVIEDETGHPPNEQPDGGEYPENQEKPAVVHNAATFNEKVDQVIQDEGNFREASPEKQAEVDAAYDNLLDVLSLDGSIKKGKSREEHSKKAEAVVAAKEKAASEAAKEEKKKMMKKKKKKIAKNKKNSGEATAAAAAAAASATGVTGTQAEAATTAADSGVSINESVAAKGKKKRPKTTTSTAIKTSSSSSMGATGGKSSSSSSSSTRSKPKTVAVRSKELAARPIHPDHDTGSQKIQPVPIYISAHVHHASVSADSYDAPSPSPSLGGSSLDGAFPVAHPDHDENAIQPPLRVGGSIHSHAGTPMHHEDVPVPAPSPHAREDAIAAAEEVMHKGHLAPQDRYTYVFQPISSNSSLASRSHSGSMDSHDSHHNSNHHNNHRRHPHHHNNNRSKHTSNYDSSQLGSIGEEDRGDGAADVGSPGDGLGVAPNLSFEEDLDPSQFSQTIELHHATSKDQTMDDNGQEEEPSISKNRSTDTKDGDYNTNNNNNNNINNGTAGTSRGTKGSSPNNASPPRARSPFERKDRFRGPQRRVLDIIEFARKSVGGPQKKQLRKLSLVERKLMDSPLAKKQWFDRPLTTESFMEDSTATMK